MSDPFWVHLASPEERWDEEVLARAEQHGFRLTHGTQAPKEAAYRVLVAGRPSRHLLAASDKLERLVIPWAGVPAEAKEELLDFPDIKVHNLHHNAQATAELAMGLLLAAARRILPMDSALRQGDWQPRYEGPHGVELRGRRTLILGYGRIGQKIAQMCRAFGMDVHATRRSISEQILEAGITIHPSRTLDRLLPEANVLVLCLPLTAETEGIIGESQLSQLPRHTILINVGRGELVEQAALYQALVDRRLAAAGLDVWYQYPESEEDRSETWPANFPFWDLDNVVLSPHRAGMVQSTNSQRSKALVQLLQGLAAGEVNRNRVDLVRGY